MLGNYFTFPELFLWIPVVFGLLLLLIKKQQAAHLAAILSSGISLVVCVISFFYTPLQGETQYFAYNNVAYYWLPYLGSSFSVSLDGISLLFAFLISFLFLIVFIFWGRDDARSVKGYYSWMLFLQAMIMGVLVAGDALVFYFFWVLMLLAVYFLVSNWNKGRAARYAQKFFIYNFVVSLILLTGILYFYQFTSQVQMDSLHSFSYSSFLNTALTINQQEIIFVCFVLSFFVLMALFPFHSWLPGMLKELPAGLNIVLLAGVLKVGLYAVVKWILPFVPQAVLHYQILIGGIGVAGMVYAALIAFGQDDLKKMIAWVAVFQTSFLVINFFAEKNSGLQIGMIGVVGYTISLVGFMMMIKLIEKSTGTMKLSDLTGLAYQHPLLGAAFIIGLFVNMVLPSVFFVHPEHSLLTGVFYFGRWIGLAGTLSLIILLLLFLNMVVVLFSKPAGKVVFHPVNQWKKILLLVMLALIIVQGICPDWVLRVTGFPIELILKKMVK